MGGDGGVDTADEGAVGVVHTAEGVFCEVDKDVDFPHVFDGGVFFTNLFETGFGFLFGALDGGVGLDVGDDEEFP